MSQNGKIPTDFVSFYNEERIMPVKQDLMDMDFQRRRKYLYRTLGIPLNLIGGARVLEFGPGGGYNATVLSDKAPLAKYWCVEGALVGSDLIQNKYSQGLINTNEFKIFQEDFLAFKSEEVFDLVIAELCIPGQRDPRATLSHISHFVAKEGYLVITCTSKSSLLSEILRGVYAKIIKSCIKDEATYEHFIHRVIGEQLMNLNTKTRSVKDWVDDNIKQNWFSRKADFNLVEAISTLSGFEFLHSSPRFSTDLSWYKSYIPSEAKAASNLKQQWPLVNAALLDCRVHFDDLAKISYSVLERVDVPISRTYDAAREFLSTEDGILQLHKLKKEIQELLDSSLLAELPTFSALSDFQEFLHCQDKLAYDLEEFGKWWGRGSQYLSFYKL